MRLYSIVVFVMKKNCLEAGRTEVLGSRFIACLPVYNLANLASKDATVMARFRAASDTTLAISGNEVTISQSEGGAFDDDARSPSEVVHAPVTEAVVAAKATLIPRIWKTRRIRKLLAESRGSKGLPGGLQHELEGAAVDRRSQTI